MKYIISAVALACLFLTSLSGCSMMDAARTEIEYKDLRINVINPDPIFLMAEPGDDVAVQIRDQSRFEVGDEVWNQVRNDLRRKGYNIVRPREARYIAQVVITSNFSEKSAREIMGSPDSGAVVGGVAGGVIGAQKGTGAAVAGAAIGVAAGALADLTSSLVKVGRLEIDGILRILEKRASPIATETRTELKQGTSSTVSQDINDSSNYKQIETTFKITAEKKKLEWEECEKEVKGLIAKQIADTFGG